MTSNIYNHLNRETYFYLKKQREEILKAIRLRNSKCNPRCLLRCTEEKEKKCTEEIKITRQGNR
jgi:hypothetical protein